MIRVAIKSLFILVLSVPAVVHAQLVPPPEQAIKTGGEVFVQTCTQSYCHGANGGAGGAPRLAGRGFNAAYIEKVVTFGIKGTPMPAWGQKLSEPELKSVIAYVESLNGIAPGTKAVPPPVLTGEAAHGRDLFFDPTEAARCSNCHRIEEKGISVAPLGKIPPDSRSLRGLETSHTVTATVRGKTFPAIVNSQAANEVKLYDLITFPPVLRTLTQSDVTLEDGSSWKHSSVLGAYTDAELDSMLEFLRATKVP